MQQSPRKSRQSLSRFEQDYLAYEVEDPRSSPLIRSVPMVVAAVLLVAVFAFAGNIIGRNADAHNSVGVLSVDTLDEPVTVVATKGSLLPDSTDVTALKLDDLAFKDSSAGDGKSDFVAAPQIVKPVPPPTPKVKPSLVAQAAPPAAMPKQVKIIPAAIDLTAEEDEPVEPAKATSAVKRLVSTPAIPAPVSTPPSALRAPVSKAQVLVAPAKPEMTGAQRLAILKARGIGLAEENCLARAVYFEARSESELGQLAVAKVILNRVKSPGFPKTICGVVYEGSERRNACQFSFACSGDGNVIRQKEAWERAKLIADRALANDPSVSMLGTATNYHADYVNPGWASRMKRLVRIGRHIFYSNQRNG